jgi:hypothetical protein
MRLELFLQLADDVCRLQEHRNVATEGLESIPRLAVLAEKVERSTVDLRQNPWHQSLAVETTNFWRHAVLGSRAGPNVIKHFTAVIYKRIKLKCLPWQAFSA